MAKVFTDKERDVLKKCASAFNNWFSNQVDAHVRRVLHRQPEECLRLFKELADLITSMNDSTSIITESSYPLLKRALVVALKAEAEYIESLSERTSNHNIRTQLDEELQSYTKLTEQDWFKKAKIAPIPKLTDFLTAQYAVEALGNEFASLPKRRYDEKFHILLAPDLFIPDLKYYRAVCGLRGKSVSVAYIDIDDFKNFNTTRGEPYVDREVLPKFMGALEFHLFEHGHAYRFGGDEYIAILPNMSGENAVKNFEHFQKEISKIEYYEITDKITVSIGIVEVSEDCPLTEREIETKAAEAKKEAKKRGKNKIVLWEGR
ncbi:MAG: GGDEF domain-containing protein [Deltaproteobacteria bacterium]|nr:GGDEF domain-containing protein [Deltaproteobacteria bacterium]